MWVEPVAPPCTVLVCDDEPLFGLSLRRLLRLRFPEARVVLAAEGEGPRLASGLTSVELIVLDLYQPVPAAEQLAAFRALPQTRDTPVLIVSAVGPISEEHRAVCREAKAVVEKPLSADFVELVRRLLLPAER